MTKLSKKVKVTLVIDLLMLILFVVLVLLNFFSGNSNNHYAKEQGYVITDTGEYLTYVRTTVVKPETQYAMSEKNTKAFAYIVKSGDKISQKDGKFTYKRLKLNGMTVQYPEYSFIMDSGENVIIIDKNFKQICAGTGEYCTYYRGKLNSYSESVQTPKECEGFLLPVGNGVYIVLCDITLVTNSMTLDLAEGDIAVFDKNVLYASRLFEGTIYSMKADTDRVSYIRIGEKEYFYNDLIAFLKTGILTEEEIPESSVSSAGVQKEFYQHFLGMKYDYPADSEILKLEDGAYIKNAGNTTKLAESPLFYIEEKEKGLYLPVDYEVISTSQSTIMKFNAFTRFTFENGYTLAYAGDKIFDLHEVFLFDGNENYIFPTGVSIHWGDKKQDYEGLVLAQLSDTGICVYELSSDTFSVLNIHGYEIFASPDEGFEISLRDMLLYKNGELMMLLGREPGLYKEYRK